MHPTTAKPKLRESLTPALASQHLTLPASFLSELAELFGFPKNRTLLPENSYKLPVLSRFELRPAGWQKKDVSLPVFISQHW